MTKNELTIILENHAKYLRGESGGKQANLSGADLSGADLSGADLSGANLSGADLSGADLSGADLSEANLSRANLSEANLSRANLSGANLSGAYLSGAYLGRADLKETIGLSLCLAQRAILPEGNLIGWKKCMNAVLVKLLIPDGAKRSSAGRRKCRASFVKVLEVIGGGEAISSHDGTTRYVVGETVKPDHWNEDQFIECAGGIHFFITREEAEAY